MPIDGYARHRTDAGGMSTHSSLDTAEPERFLAPVAQVIGRAQCIAKEKS
jgi:hypothetical protein